MVIGKPRPARSLAEQLAELDDPTPKDFDPEDLDYGRGSDDEAGVTEDAEAGREHYQIVGKGKLRTEDPIDLGKQYAGSRISRDALNADSDVDNDSSGSSASEGNYEDNESNSIVSNELSDSETRGGSREGDGRLRQADNRSKNGQNLNRKKYHTQNKQPSWHSSSSEPENEVIELGGGGGPRGRERHSSDISEDANEDIDETDSTDDEYGDEELTDMEDEDEEEEEDEEDDVETEDVNKGGSTRDDREELRRLMASDQKTIAATISQAARADAAKGKAVKQQRSTFDALLNTRIKLQKGLTAINDLSLDAQNGQEEQQKAIRDAESAACALWSTIEQLRYALGQHRPDHLQISANLVDHSGRADESVHSLSTLRSRMEDLESGSLPHRHAILDKWSAKVRGSSSALPRGRSLLASNPAGSQHITALLDSQVASETGERAAKRAKRDHDSNTNDDGNREPVYDDTLFYQSLLRDLVEQRMASSDAITNGLDNLHVHQLPSRLSLHPVTGMRNDKNRRKEVDTRASKGRKMKFTVHEKLQNFMAPEDRGTWTMRARDEFFASLLGKTAAGLLGEDEDVSEPEESDEDREEGGLKLFRS